MRWLAVLACLVAGPHVAFAFDGEAEPSRVTGRLVGTSVELTARFELQIDASIEMGFPVPLPEGSIVTRAAATVDGVHHVLALADADDAQKAVDVFFAETSPKGNHRWTVRVSGSTGLATIDVVSPLPTSKVVLELTVEMPGCFFRDRRYVLVPERWSSRFVNRQAQPSVDDKELIAACAPSAFSEGQGWISFAAPALTKRPLGEARVGAFAGRLPLGHEDLARVEIDLASELTRVPPDLHTAIVIDHSRSLSGDEVETERAAVASYLEHVPSQSRVQVIAYARTATPLLAAWLPAGTARARIDREIRALAPRNGSNVDVAIAEAGRWLARTNGTRRLIVVSDDRFASRIEGMAGEDLKALLPAGTLVHVVVVSAGNTGMALTDRTQLGGLAQLTEGIAVAAGLGDQATLDASMLVRPLGLDSVTIKGRGWEDMGIGTCPIEADSLEEGHTCTWWAKGTSIASAITIEAFLWGHKITKTLVPDATSARHLARELSARNDFLDEELRARIDRAAFAVNSAWSLIASWGGAAGFSEGGGFGFGRSGFGPGGCCSSTDFINSTTGTLRTTLDVKAQVAPIAKRCGAKTALSIYLQTTRDEIVEVTVNANDESATVRSCIEEGVWDLALSIPNAPWQASTTVKLDAL